MNVRKYINTIYFNSINIDLLKLNRMINLNFNIRQNSEEEDNVLNSLSRKSTSIEENTSSESSEESRNSESSEENNSSESSEGSSNSTVEDFYTDELMLNCILKYINIKEPINYIPLYREILRMKIYDMITSNYDFFIIDCKFIFNNNNYLNDNYILNLDDNPQLYLIYTTQLLEAITEESNWIYVNIQVCLHYIKMARTSSKSYRVFLTREKEIDKVDKDHHISRLYTPRKRIFS